MLEEFRFRTASIGNYPIPNFRAQFADRWSCDSGGEEVMLDVGGQDATEAFEDVGHSDEARETLEQLLVGTLKRQVSTQPFPDAPGTRCSVRQLCDPIFETRITKDRILTALSTAR